MTWLTETPIAHRGLHDEKDAPENTIPAFEKAIVHGYPIELDVRMLADGEIVVFHDYILGRATNKTGSVKDLRLEDLADVRLFDTDNHIPTFKEVLDVVNGRVPLLVELKSVESAGRFEGEVNDLLKTYKGEYAVQSFSPFSVRWFKNQAPDVLRGQLSSSFKGEKVPFLVRLISQHMLLNGSSKPDFVAYGLRDLPFWVTNAWRKRRKPLLAWTVENDADREKAITVADNYIFENIRPK